MVGSAFSSKVLSTVMPLNRSEYPRKQSLGVSAARLNFENQLLADWSKGTGLSASDRSLVEDIAREGRTPRNLEEAHRILRTNVRIYYPIGCESH